MVDEQQLKDAALCLLGLRRGVLGADDHALGDRRGARRERLALTVDVDEALTKSADRIEQRVVTEARNLDADRLGRTNDERALRDLQLDAVDGDRDGVYRSLDLGRVGGHSHALLPAVAKIVE